MPTTQVDGVLILHYRTPTVTQTFYNTLRFGITWINRGTIVFTEPLSGSRDTLYLQ